MKKKLFVSSISLMCISALFSACGNQQNSDANTGRSIQLAQSINGQEMHNQKNTDQKQQEGSSIQIPSYDANEHSDHGSTSIYDKNAHMMGSSVYSLIGSSSLHDGGISAHIQSRLGGAGINGINVLVLDDTVILAQTSNEITSSHYDPMQDKLLNNTSGTSATGPARRGEPAGATGGGTDDSQVGTYGTSGSADSTDNNLEEAHRQIQAMFGGNITILHVTDRESSEAIERIKGALKSNDRSLDSVSKDLAVVLKKAAK